MSIHPAVQCLYPSTSLAPIGVDAMEFDTGFQQYSTVHLTQLYPKMPGRVELSEVSSAYENG